MDNKTWIFSKAKLRPVNPISTKGEGGGGEDYAHQIILAPPDFQTFLQP